MCVCMDEGRKRKAHAISDMKHSDMEKKVK